MPVTLNSVLQVLLFLVIVLLLTKPLGLYMYKIFNGERTWLSPVFVPVERFFYRLCGVNPEEEQKWTGYMISVLIFSVVGMLLLYLHSSAPSSGRARSSTRRACPMSSRSWPSTPPPASPPTPTGRTIPASRP